MEDMRYEEGAVSRTQIQPHLFDFHIFASSIRTSDSATNMAPATVTDSTGVKVARLCFQHTQHPGDESKHLREAHQGVANLDSRVLPCPSER
jgi:hypothetical protein